MGSISSSCISLFVIILLSSFVLNSEAQRPTNTSISYIRFTAQVSIYNDPTVSGRLSGTLTYNWLNTTGVTRRIDYSIGPTTEIIQWTKVTTSKYTKCDSSCEAETSNDPTDYMFLQTNDKSLGYTIILNGITCLAYNRTNTTTQQNSLTTLFVESTGKLCRVVYYSGKTIDFTGVSNDSIPDSVFVIDSAWNCPIPKCDAQIDIIYLYDLSGSISNVDFEYMRNFTYQLSDSFNIGSDAVRIGIIFFANDAQVILPISNSKVTVLQTISTMKRINGGTYIGKGLDAVRTNMPANRNGVNVAKIMVILTDAGASDAATFNNSFVNLTRSGVISIAIGCGSINQRYLNTLTSRVDGIQTQFKSDNYATLSQVLTKNLVAQTCQPLPGIGSCGINCKGFCSCNKQCYCPSNCNDNNVCTNDFCNVGQNGNGCQNPSITCDDNNKCTDKFCNSVGGCYFVNKTASYCDDGLKCTDDTCVPSFGCQSLPRDCRDDDPCTLDSCDEASGQCVHTIQYDCVCSRKTCPFLNNCTQNICDVTDGECKPATIDCNDNNFCTDDSCNNATGCVYKPHNCSDGSKCTFDQCDSKAGVCVNPPITCDDGDICTENNCNAATGCVFPLKPKSYCDDGRPCTNDTCVSPSIGCINTPITCNDGDACTIDKCVNGTNSNAYTCSNIVVPSCLCQTKICPVIAGCVINQCNNDNGNCEQRPKPCDDGNVCTVDSCNNSTSAGCFYVPKNCTDNNLCTIDTCDSKVSGGCVYKNRTCDDLDICTDDTCAPSIGCVFTNKSASFCDDGLKCTIDTCVHGGIGCLNKPIDCNDNDICTADSCDENTGTCLNVPDFNCFCARTTCPFVNNCTLNYCNTTDGTCDQAPINCDDGNPCTDDFCDNNSGCYYQAHVCDDINACTIDTCDRNVVGGCVYTELNATSYDDLNACTKDFCDNITGVHHDNITCNDDNACTYDTCESVTGCLFVDKDCGALLGAAVESKCSLAMCNATDSTGFGCYATISPNAEFDDCGECFGKGLNCVSKVTIGIGAGVIAAITIGSLAAFGAIFAGGYGGVKAYQKYRTTMETAHNNPLFVEKQDGGDNPLYKDDNSFIELKGK